MRTTVIALYLCALLPACSGSVSYEQSSSSSASSSGAGGGSSSASSSTSSGTGGHPPPSQKACSFEVSGFYDLWVDGPDAQSIGIPSGWIECAATVDGYTNVLAADIGAFHGPGTYVAIAYDDYQRYKCDNDGCKSQDFTSTVKGIHCVFELSEAPTQAKKGDAVAGTFSCEDLVDETDPSLSRVVSIHDGSFSGVLGSEPD